MAHTSARQAAGAAGDAPYELRQLEEDLRLPARRVAEGDAPALDAHAVAQDRAGPCRQRQPAVRRSHGVVLALEVAQRLPRVEELVVGDVAVGAAVAHGAAVVGDDEAQVRTGDRARAGHLEEVRGAAAARTQ